MSKQGKINCHYVTESLTKDWEITGGWLSFFNFQTHSIEKELSKNLFAKIGLNSPKIELDLSRLVETHLGRFKKKIYQSKVTETNNWSLYRSLYLYFIFQVKRFAKANSLVMSEDSKSLDELLEKDEHYLNSLTQVFQQEFNIVIFSLPNGHLLFFPETGFFQFPIDDDQDFSGFSLATAVPINPYMAMALVKKTANLVRFHEFHGIIGKFSVGLNNNSSRVLIPPVLLEHLNAEEIIKVILESREEAKKQVELIVSKASLIQEMRNIIVQAFA